MTERQSSSCMHPHWHDPEHLKGLRAVASVEFTKGVIVLLAGLGALSLRHKEIWGVAESFLEFVHANPYNHYVGVFISIVYKVHSMHLWKVALVAGIYTLLRFIESYGLWFARAWAEWLAAVSGAVYIPFEVADQMRRVTWFGMFVLVVNVAIVAYMLLLRLEARRKRHARMSARSE